MLNKEEKSHSLVKRKWFVTFMKRWTAPWEMTKNY